MSTLISKHTHIMAYGYRRPYRRRRTLRRRRPATFRRRTYGTRKSSTRSTRRTYRRRKPMTQRRVLDVTSTKKRDEMPILDPANPTNAFLTIAGGPITQTLIYAFCPTARDMTDSDAPSVRTKKEVYWKGFSETLSFTIATGVSWKWRRIVVETKFWRLNDSYAETSSGDMRRIFRPFNEEATWGLIFKGATSADWNSTMMAHVDTQRCKLISDTTRVMRSGNASPHEHYYKLYYPFERRMIYDDDENGGTVSPNTYFSAPTPFGMGDVYIFDFFQCIAGATGDALNIRSQSTAYWHEK